MKNRYITAAACLALCLLTECSLLYAQTGSMNYIKTIELMAGVTTPEGVNGLPEDLKRTTISYFDGLGRPIQEVTVAKSPGRKDLVQHIEYDALGRNPRQYLPFTAATQGGGYHANAMNSLQQFYSGSVPGVPLTGVYYAQTDFEPSPLNRVLHTASPGEAWSMDMGHAVSYGYEANQPYEVMHFTVNGDVVSCSAPTHYDANTLYKNSVTDEDGQTSITYTDLEGRVVMKRAVLGSNNFADTYYVYNELGLLVCVMMPEANKTTGIFSDFKNAFLYKYDARKRMVRKQIPGADSICYVYNKADLLVAEQDGNMRKQGKWKYFKYDRLGRVIIEGLLTSTQTRVLLAQTVANYGDNLYEQSQSPAYTSTAFPAGSPSVMLTNFYDDYYINSANPNYYINHFLSGFSDPKVLHVNGQLTVRKTATSSGVFLEETFFYDDQYRLVQHYTNEYAGKDQIYITGNFYHFNGALKQSKKYFKYSTNPAYEYSFSYIYDHDWRPDYTEMKVGGTVQRLNTMQYNELAQLETKYLHGDATDYLQRQDYAYNIRGWLTGINRLQQGSTVVFAQKLYYNTVPPGTTGQATARFNGNISASEWRVDGITPTDFSSGYAYSYDPLNRLTKAAYYKRNIGSSVIGWEGAPASNKSSWGEITGIGSEKDITYDKNGNIKTLSRQARRNSDTDIVLFDNLSYTYNGNVLLRVSDAVIGQNTLGDFPGTAEQATETFFYDKNGNMTSDAVRGLRLSYDHNNMPLVIQSSDGTITNTYAWDGTKRRRVVKDENNNTLSDECYYGDLVVENGQPLRILHAEGYVDVSGMPVFNYHLKDHLGNVRAVISSSYGTGAFTQTQASDYYPFGMAHTVEISSVKNGKAMEAVRVDPRETDDSKTFTRSNAHLYNGKEEQPMPGKWLDYGARFYDAQLGRWHTPEPFAELIPGIGYYAYCYNNPINYLEPDGRWPSWVHKRIIKKALNPYIGHGLTIEQLDQIIEGGIFVDKHMQAANLSYRHSMRDGLANQTIESAKKARTEWVSNNIAVFKATGNYKALGFAIHAVSDEHAPTHNWKPWRGQSAWHPSAWIHAFGELNPLGSHSKAFKESVNLVVALYKYAHIPSSPDSNDNPSSMPGSEPPRFDPIPTITPIPPTPIPNPLPAPSPFIPIPSPTPIPVIPPPTIPPSRM